jgi:hypothetical protein
MGFITRLKTRFPGNPQSKNQFMKTSVIKLAQTPQTPVFPQTLHRLRPNLQAATPSQKRDNTFSQSRDTREDRGQREMKTTHNSQTFPHGR